MRWLAVSFLALALFLVGWTTGQQTQNDEKQEKLKSLEERVAKLEKRFVELEGKVERLDAKVSELNLKVSRLTLSRQAIIIPQPIPVPQPRLEWRLPEEWRGFGLPKPAPQPFVQPYYYPLEGKP